MTLPYPNSPDKDENIAASISRIEQNLEYLDGVVSLTSFYVKYFTQALDTNDDVSISGVGFQPTAVILFSIETTGNSSSWGMGDDSLNVGHTRQEYDGDTNGDDLRIGYLQQTIVKYTRVVLKEFTADGCTLTLSAGNSPTGNGIFMAVFMR